MERFVRYRGRLRRAFPLVVGHPIEDAKFGHFRVKLNPPGAIPDPIRLQSHTIASERGATGWQRRCLIVPLKGVKPWRECRADRVRCRARLHYDLVPADL